MTVKRFPIKREPFERVGLVKVRLLSARLGFAYAEDRGPAYGAHALYGRLAVLERDRLRVLDLPACLALYAVCFWHISSEAPLSP